MKSKATFLLLTVLITSGRAAAVPPTIHVRWDNPASAGDVPELGTHYFVTGNPDSPNIQLAAGRDDWRIWSTDVGYWGQSLFSGLRRACGIQGP